MYGADALTMINKAIDNNKKYSVKKDDKGFYIEDDEHSLVIILILLSNNEQNEIEEKTIRMEMLENAGLDKFISNFGLTTFQYTKIEYNSRKLVKRIYLKQIEL